MLPDRVSNPGPLTYESGALPIALRGPAPGKLTIPEAISLKITWIFFKTKALLFLANKNMHAELEWPVSQTLQILA